MSHLVAPSGDCFIAAFGHIANFGAADLDGKRFLLVHGNLINLPQDQPRNHAWVEEGDVVHEVSNGMEVCIKRETYYSDFQIKNARSYTLIEAMRMLEEYGHYGAWPD